MSFGYLILSISVPEVLGKGSNISEVLWNFSRFKDPEHRITLDQNPHFYKELPQEYGADFQCDPIHNFLDTPGHKIFVLTDRPSWIWLESGQVSRAFSNVWCPQNAIIFKSLSESSLAFSIFAHAHFGILQTSAENSRVKGLSDHPSERSLAYSGAWSICRLLQR